jgi:transposase
MLQAYDAKLGSQSQIAKMFQVSRKCLCDLLRLRRQTGSLAPRPHGGGRQAAYQGKTLERLRELVEQQSDATLEELRQRTGVACSLTAVHNAIVRLDLRFKKSPSTPASKTVPMSSSGARRGASRRPT